jgi:undecaprenyl-diphosphatase
MRWLHKFDKNTSAAVQKLPAGWSPLMKGVSWLGEPIIVLTVGAISFAISIKQGLDSEAKSFVLAAVSFWLCVLLKFVLQRRRPSDINIESLGLKSYSFPSGHAFGPVLFYGLMAYLDFSSLSSPLNLFMTAGLCLLVFLVGVSRVYLRVHYPSDVIGGWLIGLAFLVVIITPLF